MKWVDFEVNQRKSIKSQDVDSCQLFGCQYHGINLVMNEEGQVFTINNEVHYIFTTHRSRKLTWT
jgi:hypothetical protein